MASSASTASAAPQQRADGNIVLESDQLRVVIDPKMGGKVRSLFSIPSNWEYFFQDHNPLVTETDYSGHDISGMDECFPTVGVCSLEEGSRAGLFLGDHGMLWNRAWQTEIAGDTLKMKAAVPELGITFERAMRLSAPNELTLDYQIAYSGPDPLPYIYSLHPLFSGHSDSQFLLPKTERVYVEAALHIDGLADKQWFAPESVRGELVRKFDGGRNACLKCFYTNVTAPRAGLYHPHIDQTLVIDFDTQANPHLGVLTFEGYAPTPDAPYRNKLFFALEPTNGVGDDHAGGRATKTLRELKAGETLRFATKMRIEPGKAKIKG